MPKFSQNHPSFRTKERIIADLTHVLSAPLADGTKKLVLIDAARTWTDFDGKYSGPWTAKAVEEYRTSKSRKLLRHEHIVPLAVVTDLVFSLEVPTLETVQEIFDKFVRSVIVTLDEDRLLSVKYHKSMPPEFDDPTSQEYRDPWLRYKRCGIELTAELLAG